MRERKERIQEEMFNTKSHFLKATQKPTSVDTICMYAMHVYMYTHICIYIT